MTLPQGWTVEEDPKDALPPGWSFEEEEPTGVSVDFSKGYPEIKGYKPREKRKEPFRDVVSENLRAMGYEPDFSEELERRGELGIAEGLRGLLSGASLGLTEQIPGLETGDTFASEANKFIGSVLPISRLVNFFEGQTVNLASKSPVFQKQLSSLASLLGVGVGAAGATYEGAEELIASGELPSADDLLENGFLWAAVDIALRATGKAYQFTKSLLTRADKTGKPSYEVLNETLNQLREQGVDFTTPEIASAKALEVLNRPIEQGEIRELKAQPKKESPINTKAQEILNNPSELQFDTRLSLSPEKVVEKPISQVVKTAEEAISQQEIKPKDLKTRKIDERQINNLTKQAIPLSEPYLPESIDFVAEADALGDSAIESQIDSLAPRSASQEELGDTIRENVESQLEANKEAYAPLYRESEQAAEAITYNPKNIAREAGERLRKLERLKTRPADYSNTINKLETILADAGYQIQRAEDGTIETIVQGKDVAVSDLIELGRRVNNLIDYETIDPKVRSILKPVAAAVKQDVRAGLKSVPDALTAYELAEAEHGRVAGLFNRDSIRKARTTEAGERVAKMIDSPSALSDLRNTLPPEQMKQIEREILERLQGQSYEKAQKQFRELQRHLSEDSRRLAKDIVEAKNPHNSTMRRRLMQDAILNDMSNALTTGARPEKTLNLWKTPKGQRLVRESFNNSPNWRAVEDYLKQQSFNDMVSSVLKSDGALDIKKLKNFMRDPGAVNNIRMLGGDEAVEFFKGMDAQVKQLEANVKLLDKLPKESDLSRGKELIKKQKRKNIEEQERIKAQTEAEKKEQKRLNEIISKRSEGQRGKDLIRRTKEKIQLKPKASQVAEESIETQKRIAKETKGERGSKILLRMMQKDFPKVSKAKAWKDWFSETLGLTPKAAMSVFGLMKLGIPHTVVSMLAVRYLNKLATNPRVRKAFREAAKHYTNPIEFIAAIEGLGETLEE